MNTKTFAQGTTQTQKADFLNKVWTDEAYRAQLAENPKAALAEFGSPIDENIEVKFVMDTDKVKYLHIPSAPAQQEISDADLMGAQGGSTWLCVVTVLTAVGTLVSATENPP